MQTCLDPNRKAPIAPCRALSNVPKFISEDSACSAFGRPLWESTRSCLPFDRIRDQLTMRNRA
jgi:hypothetical protein